MKGAKSDPQGKEFTVLLTIRGLFFDDAFYYATESCEYLLFGDSSLQPPENFLNLPMWH